MTRVCQWAMALTLALLMTAAAPGQDKKRRGGRGAGGFGGGQLMLLGQKSVQEELKLSEQQIEKVAELSKKNREGFKDLKDLSQEDLRKRLAETSAANAKALTEILKKDQSKRLKEIGLQTRGGSALADPEVASALKLTDEQKEKVKSIREESRGKGRGGFSPEARKAAQEKLMGVLTDEQKSTWKTMTGEPFKGEIQQFPRGKGRPKGATPRKKKDILEDVNFFTQDDEKDKKPAAKDKKGKGPKGFGKGSRFPGKGPWAGKDMGKGKGPKGFGKGREGRGAWARSKDKGSSRFTWSRHKGGRHMAFGPRHHHGHKGWMGRHGGHRHGWAGRSGRGMGSRYGHHSHRHGWAGRHHGKRSPSARGWGGHRPGSRYGWSGRSFSARPKSSSFSRGPSYFGRGRGPSSSSRDIRADLERIERALADLQRKLRR